jgi:heme/copper-type cytochrome/quinol oxidase subunit 4
MNKRLKGHIYSTLLYLVVLVIVFYKNDTITNEVRYILATAYALIQIEIEMLCYLESWYDSTQQ